MRNKEAYIRFCESNPDMPVFLKDWWLDAVYGDDWDVLFYKEEDKVLAAMPYSLHRKFGFSSILPPQLTPVTGLWIAYPENMSRLNRYSLEIKAMDDFAKQIDGIKPDYFLSKFHHSLCSWLGFHWNGYSQTTRYTYRFDLTQGEEALLAMTDKSVRKRIRKLEKEDFVIRTDLSTKEFYQVNCKTYERQKMNCPFSYEQFERIDKEAEKRNISGKYAICDAEGNVHSVAYVIFDNKVCQGIFSGSNPSYRQSNAATLLLWHILKESIRRGCAEYDFNGSMLKPIETFIRHFGAEQTPYFLIEKKYSKLYSLLKKLKR